MDRVELLRGIVLFDSLPEERLAPVRDVAERRVYAEGEAIFSHGEPADYFYVVETGMVDVAVPARAGEIVVASFEPGSFFGELAVFDRQSRSATARAVSATALICIPLEAVRDVLEDNPPAARQFISVLSQRLRAADELLSRLQVQNLNDLVEQRMSFGERVADRVARFGGSWTFIICFGAFLLLWMGINSLILLGSPPDPFPYIFLNLILSCVAALQAPVIMMSQNRQAAKDRVQADLEFQINVKAEIAVQQLHRKLDELRSTLLQHQHSHDGGRKTSAR